MKRILLLLLTAIELTSCATSYQPVPTPGPGSTMATGVLLADTMKMVNREQMLARVPGYCKHPVLESIKPYNSPGQYKVDRAGHLIGGHYSEIWLINRCGRYYPLQVTFTTDATGTNISIKKLPVSR